MRISNATLHKVRTALKFAVEDGVPGAETALEELGSAQKVCAFCHNEYIARDPRQMYCSRWCGQTRSRKR